MKRNRLLSNSPHSRLFSSEKPAHSKRHHLLLLSLLTVIGIFLTTIVLATSSPVPTNIQSQSIPLPGQSSHLQDIQAPSVHSAAVNAPVVAQIPVPDSGESDVTDSAQLEQLHLQEATQTDTVVSAQDASNNLEPVAQLSSEPELDWQEITVKSGDNLSLLFPKIGLTARDVYEVAQSGDSIKPLLNLKPGQVLRFGLSHTDEKTSLKKLELKLSPIETLQLTRTENGYTSATLTREVDSRQKQVAGRIESSLFEAGQKAGMSDKLIMEMAHIFGWDIDFALDLRQGDSFKVIFEESFLDGKKFDDGDILAAEFTNRGNTFRAIRYTDPEGNSHFYTPEGHSMRKTFTRTPVHFSRISSRFNPNRKHPVLKTSRPHRGVDYAAPTGTPILATGDGKVDFVGTKGGYGRTIILSHGGKYTTLYAHMSRFKKDLKKGQRVKQGQTIGYVGSSGLATGPHLHYEFRINNVHHNPLTVSLPKAKPLDAKYMADFKQRAQPLLAQLDGLSPPAVAFNQ